jgi:hypothetical protein
MIQSKDGTVAAGLRVNPPRRHSKRPASSRRRGREKHGGGLGEPAQRGTGAPGISRPASRACADRRKYLGFRYANRA